jgi:predicted amidohydrolase
MRIKIAVVQFAIQQIAPQENLRKAEQFIKEAVSQQAQIIVFPEDFVTGPLSGNNAFADYERRYVKHFQQLALQYSIDIVPAPSLRAIVRDYIIPRITSIELEKFKGGIRK